MDKWLVRKKVSGKVKWKMLKLPFSISLGGCQYAIIWFMVTSWGTYLNSGSFWLITGIHTITIVLGDSKFSQNKFQWTLSSAYTLCLRWWRPREFQGLPKRLVAENINSIWDPWHCAKCTNHVQIYTWARCVPAEVLTMYNKRLYGYFQLYPEISA